MEAYPLIPKDLLLDLQQARDEYQSAMTRLNNATHAVIDWIGADSQRKSKERYSSAELVEAASFVDRLIAFADRRAKGTHGWSYLLIWYARRQLKKGAKPVYELIAERLGPQDLGLLQDALKFGWVGLTPVQVGNSLKNVACRLAREFKGGLSRAEKRRWKGWILVLVPPVIPGLLGSGTAHAAAGKVSTFGGYVVAKLTAVSTLAKVVTAALVGTIAATWLAPIHCSGSLPHGQERKGFLRQTPSAAVRGEEGRRGGGRSSLPASDGGTGSSALASPLPSNFLLRQALLNEAIVAVFSGSTSPQYSPSKGLLLLEEAERISVEPQSLIGHEEQARDFLRNDIGPWKQVIDSGRFINVVPADFARDSAAVVAPPGWANVSDSERRNRLCAAQLSQIHGWKADAMHALGRYKEALLLEEKHYETDVTGLSDCGKHESLLWFAIRAGNRRKTGQYFALILDECTTTPRIADWGRLFGDQLPTIAEADGGKENLARLCQGPANFRAEIVRLNLLDRVCAAARKK